MGSFLAPAIAGWLATITWQYPFLLYALAFPVVALVYAGTETMPENATNTALTATVRDYGRQLRTELVDRDLNLLVAGGFIHGASRIAVITFVPLESGARARFSTGDASGAPPPPEAALRDTWNRRHDTQR